jgi:hypothetical protein
MKRFIHRAAAGTLVTALLTLPGCVSDGRCHPSPDVPDLALPAPGARVTDSTSGQGGPPPL